MKIPLIIVITVIILLAVVIYLSMPIKVAPAPINDMDAWNKGCNIWKTRGCKLSDVNEIKIPEYDWNNDGTYDTIAIACSRAFGYLYGELKGQTSYTAENVSDNPCWVKCCAFV